jgi:hypothetical protein
VAHVRLARLDELQRVGVQLRKVVARVRDLFFVFFCCERVARGSWIYLVWFFGGFWVLGVLLL